MKPVLKTIKISLLTVGILGCRVLESAYSATSTSEKNDPIL